jgi:hypothetical protein
MSRSKRKTPKGGITKAKSEKFDKRMWNRLFRSRSKTMLQATEEFDSLSLPMNIHKETEIFDGAKDGKTWYNVRYYSVVRLMRK